MKVCKDKYKI